MNSLNLAVITISFSYPSKELSYTLDSLFAQSCKSFLLVLVISKISSDSINLLASTLDSHQITYSLIANQDHSLYDAMNKGLDMAGRRPALFLNAGDRFLSSSTVRTIVSKYVNNASNAFSLVNTFDGRVGFIRLSSPQAYAKTIASLFKKYILFTDATRLPPHPSLVSNYVFGNGTSARFPIDCSYHADSLLLHNLLSDVDVVYHDDPIIVFHLDGVSSMPSFLRIMSYLSRKRYTRSVFEGFLLCFMYIIGQRRYFEIINIISGNKKVDLSCFS